MSALLRPQSALMPANFTTLPHFSVSSAISLPKSAGEPGSPLPPKSASRSLILGLPRLALISLLSLDRKSTRLNSSHLGISYAVFCLKKKKNNKCNIKLQLNKDKKYIRPHPTSLVSTRVQHMARSKSAQSYRLSRSCARQPHRQATCA